MGIGDAYLGLVDLLSHNGKHLLLEISLPRPRNLRNAENCTEGDTVVQYLIGFVADTTIQSVRRATDDSISAWYHEVSLFTCLQYYADDICSTR